MVSKLNKIIILGGSKGIGKSIFKETKSLAKKSVACSRKEIDTSNLESVRRFVKKYKSTDVLVLNSGGPPNIKFNEISENDWYKYFNQLFLGYCIILKSLKINKNGYIFYISSSIIKEPSENLIISSSLRVAFSSVLKSLSLQYAKKNISIINIAPGPFKTQRVKELIKNVSKVEKTLPFKKLGDPEEIGKFVNFVIRNKIKYLSGTIVNFDGSISKNLF
tara:strand:+ start:790 stop:1449 length:660 start_codon:yes stop_codon:yes gene_type:complete